MKLNIAIVDPFLDVSHAYWADQIGKHSEHHVDVYALPPKYWKWQMIGGTYELAKQIQIQLSRYDLIIVTDMLDLPCFIGYLRGQDIPPVVLYFHENQITYPWSANDLDIKKERDYHYSVMNLRSAIVADQVVFNSEYHRESFIKAIPDFVKMFPGKTWMNEEKNIKSKSTVLPIPMDFSDFRVSSNHSNKPVFLWNHRWEYDKGPDAYFNILIDLKEDGFDFGLIVLGKAYDKQPEIFATAKEVLKKEIIHWGYAEDKNEYLSLVNRANIMMVTGHQDFFGISVIEGIAAGCIPILPNRLAYPEHIPDELKSKSLYEEGELLLKIKETITKKEYLDTRLYSEYILKYEAMKVVKKYDDLIQKTVLSPKKKAT